MKLEKYRRVWDSKDTRGRMQRLLESIDSGLEIILFVMVLAVILRVTVELILG